MKIPPPILVTCSFGDPRNSKTWAGTPANIIRCLERRGVSVAAVPSDATRVEKAALSVIHRVAGMGGAYRRGPLSRRRSANRVEEAARRAGARHVLHFGSLDLPIGGERGFLSHSVLCDSTWNLWTRYASEVAQMPDRMVRLAEEMEREALGGVDHVFAVSAYVRDNIVSHYGVPLDRVTVVGTGRGAIEPYYGKKDYARGHILFAGRERLIDKGCPLLLDAFRLALARRPDLSLVLVGSDEYKQIAKDIPNVVVKGHVPWAELEALFRDAALFAQPAPNEPWGLVYLEALASRTPVLGLNRNALPEITQGGKYGFLADAPDPESVADKLLDACADPDRLEAMGRAGQTHCLREFSWERAAERIGAVVLGGTRTAKEARHAM